MGGRVLAGAVWLALLTTPALPAPVPSLPTLPSPPISLPSVPPIGGLPTAVPSVLPTGVPTGLPSAAPSAGAAPSPAPSAGVSRQPAPSPNRVAPTGVPGTPPSAAASAPPSSTPGERGSRFLAVTLPSGALGDALVVALAVLPLLLGIGLLLVGRVWGEGRRLRSSRLRLALAADLDLKPRELAQLSPAALVKLRDQVTFDELTGVLRRAAGVASVEREVARARRAGEPLTVAFIDLDGLRRINDRQGQRAGDAALKAVARVLYKGLREEDLVFRYGGDEFVAVLPGLTAAGAEAKLQHLHAGAMARGLSFTFGVAELRPEDDLVSFLGRADQCLYDARANRDGHGPLPALLTIRPQRRSTPARSRPRSEP